MAITARRMTLDEFLKLPEEKPALELIDGVVRQKVSPMARHGALQVEFGAYVNAWARPRRIAYAFTEMRGRYRDDSLVPDVAIYRWHRIPLLPDGSVSDELDAPADIAVEILSPGQRVRDAIDKCRRYVASGTKIALLVNPRDETVRLFRPGVLEVVLRGEDRIDLDEVLPGFELTVAGLFNLVRLG